MKSLIIIIMMLLVSGCVTISAELEDGRKIKYSRWLGSQNFEDLNVKTKSGLEIHIGKQSGKNSLDKTFENISATLKNISEVATGIPLPE